MYKLNHSNITHGLLVKLLSAVRNSLRVVGSVTIVQNRKGEFLMSVRSLVVNGVTKVIVLDSTGTNITLILSRGTRKLHPLLNNVRWFITSSLLWNHEVIALREKGIPC